MDEIVLVKESLSDTEINQGRELLNKLEAKGFRVEAAYWVFQYERNNWGFHIVTPEVSRLGWPKADMLVQKAVDPFPAKFQLSLFVDGLEDRFYKHMLELRRDTAFTNIELDRLPVGGDLVDLYVYRLPAPNRRTK
jgi:hypothetical protein